jgi:hypothetical protein
MFFATIKINIIGKKATEGQPARSQLYRKAVMLVRRMILSFYGIC